jgi:3-hydroxyacyl-CoA dehydrogenase
MVTTSYEVTDRVAVVRFDNPPVNGLSHATREGIAAGVQRATEDAAVDAIVLTGRPRFFSAGADITEFNTPAAGGRPRLGEVIAAIEDCAKPVIAAIEGAALGGGLELALAAHYRVATAASHLGLPEVNLGLVPGAGGTQRLPRVLDIAVAAELITSGTPRTAATLGAVPGQRLLDRVVPEDAVAAAVAFAGGIAATRRLPRIRDLIATPGDLGALRDRLTKRSRGFHAPLAALDLVELAATTAFDDGLTRERETFQRLVGGDQSAALRHAFFAERAARRIPGLAADVKARPVAKVGVIGAGTMGGGIAMNFLNVGLPVTIVETKQEALDRGLGVLRRNYQAQVDRGKLTEDGLATRLGLLTPSLDYADVADCDLVIEAVFEDMAVKQAVFTRLDELVKPGAVLASNTSGLDLDTIAGFTRRPAEVVGMHFFSPANVMKLLEVVRGDQTADDVLATAMAMGQLVGKTSVVAKVCPGFIGNRMLAGYRQAASELVRSGARPADIDTAIERFGFAMGPFRMGDLAGLDIGWAGRKRRYAEHPDTPKDEIGDALCELGRFGQKTGGGWYDYESGSRAPKQSPVVEGILAEFWARHGVTPTSFGPESIAQQLVFALVDAGARILAEGIALRASDIDVVYLSGYGFPRHVGGPMWYADTVGLPTVVDSLRRSHGDGWEPAPLLVRLAAEGSSFRAFDGG